MCLSRCLTLITHASASIAGEGKWGEERREGREGRKGWRVRDREGRKEGGVDIGKGGEEVREGDREGGERRGREGMEVSKVGGLVRRKGKRRMR